MSDDGTKANFDHILRERADRDDAERVRKSMLSVVRMHKRLEAAEALLGRWMYWASGVAFMSPYGEDVQRDTDAFLAPAGLLPATNRDPDATRKNRQD